MNTACTNTSCGVLMSRSFLSFSPVAFDIVDCDFLFDTFSCYLFVPCVAGSSSFLLIQYQWSCRFWPQAFTLLLVSIFSLNEFMQVLLLQLVLPYWKLLESLLLTSLLNPNISIQHHHLEIFQANQKLHVWIHPSLFPAARPILLASFSVSV